MQVASRADLRAWLDRLARDKTLIAPKVVEQQTLFRAVASSEEIAFDAPRTDLSAKEHFVPATETLFTIQSRGRGVGLVEPESDGTRVLFGLRPCDARALRVLDALFLEKEPVDPYYARRRGSTALVAVACREMGAECFCTSLGSAPDEAANADLLLSEVDTGYAVQAVTGKGQALLDGLALTEVAGTPPKPATREPSAPGLEANEWIQRFENAYWSRLSDRCLSCRVCTYVCPTCRCFDVRDGVTSDGQVGRLRAWDSCLAGGYRRLAGGHDPRPTKAQRLRNRVYCKFCYYPKDYGPVACVGCGRCIAKCPVNVDLAEVLRDMATL